MENQRKIKTPIFLAVTFAATLAFSQQPDYGKTTFPNSGKPAAQEVFLQGLLMLHSFQYEDARESFQEAQRIDGDFAMAYWGEAMTHNHPVWFRQNRETARAALAKLGETPEARLAKHLPSVKKIIFALSTFFSGMVRRSTGILNMLRP